MSQLYEIDAELRSDVGKGASRRLRHNNAVPAILYGADMAPQNLTLSHNQLTRALKFESFYSHILTINVAGEKQRAILKALQRHPFKPKVLHADFQRIDENEKIHIHVPLHFINEDRAPGVKLSGGLITHLRNEIEISCLPAHLPEYIEVDMANLELGHSIHLSDLKLPQGVELPELVKGAEHDQAIANILQTRGGTAAEDDSASADADEDK